MLQAVRQCLDEKMVVKMNINVFLDMFMSDPCPSCLMWLPLLHRMASVEHGKTVPHPPPATTALPRTLVVCAYGPVLLVPTIMLSLQLHDVRVLVLVS